MSEELDLRVDAIRHYVKNPPKDGTDLHRLATAISGHNWLTQSLCRRHAAPWDLIHNVFFDAASEVLGIGPRSGFKTQTLGLLNALEMLAKPGVEIVHAAASLKQASRAHMFTKQYLQTDAVRASGLVEGAKFNKWEMTTSKGSKIEVLPGTVGGLNSAHAQRLRLDEFELIKADVIDDARMVPGSYNGYERNICFVSARKFRNGNVDRVLQDRKFADVKKLIWCVGEVVERCPPERHGTREMLHEVEDPLEPGAPPLAVRAFDGCAKCPLVPDCRGQFANANGWAKIDDLVEEFAKLDRASWNSQKRSRKVEQVTGVVFRFSRRRHVRDMEILPGIPLSLVVDFGGGARGRTCVLFWQEADGIARILAEYFGTRGDPDDDVPEVERILTRTFPGVKIGEAIGDSAVPNIIRMWNQRAMKFRLNPVKKLGTKRDMIRTLTSLVDPVAGEPRYLVHSRCTRHIEEMMNFRENDRIVSRVRQSAYTDEDVDSVDAASYLSLQVGDVEKSQPRVWVIDTHTHRVENSDPPIKFHDGKDLTYETYVGVKLQRLLRRSRP